MPTAVKPPENLQRSVRSAIAKSGLANAAAARSVAPATLSRVAEGLGVNPGTLVRLSRFTERIRKADEFAASTSAELPIRKEGPFAWDLESIRNARNQQMLGVFETPVRLAEAMRTDDALYTAYMNRVAPSQAIATSLTACDGARGAPICGRAQSSCIVPRTVLGGIVGTMANHGIAIGQIKKQTLNDGTRTDMRLEEWPLEFVRWDRSRQLLLTRTKAHPNVPIVHGDGEWVIFRKFFELPWKQAACLLPGAFIYAAHGNAVRDWAGASLSHGSPKLLGTAPDQVSLEDKDADGNTVLSATAQGQLQMLQDLASGAAGAGIQPFGAATQLLYNGSTAWQVFSELILDRKKAAASVYQGTDAFLGAAGGAPGVDITALFGVALTIVISDFKAVQDALNTGLYQPWTAINYGDSRYAPSFAYEMPDAEAAAKATENFNKRKQLTDTIKEYKAQGFIITQGVINNIAAELGLRNPPQIAPVGANVVPLTLAPTDIAQVVLVHEARASQGLPLLGDDRDNMTIGEVEAQAKLPPVDPNAAALPSAPVTDPAAAPPAA